MFISLEGIDGCGKSTLHRNLITHLTKEYQVVSIREPGGTVVSEKLREIILDVRNNGIKDKTEAFLYATARSQVVEEVILPALAQGKIVIADRFLDSTIAYQGYGRGLDIDFLEDLNRLCTGGLKPDLTFLIDVSPEIAQKRKNGAMSDRLEKVGIEFQKRVQLGYLLLCVQKSNRIIKLDGRQSIEKLTQTAIKIIERRYLNVKF